MGKKSRLPVQRWLCVVLYCMSRNVAINTSITLIFKRRRHRQGPCFCLRAAAIAAVMGTTMSEPCIYDKLSESIDILRQSGYRYGMSEREIERFIKRMLESNEPRREPPQFPILRATIKFTLAVGFLLVVVLAFSYPQSSPQLGLVHLGSYNWSSPLSHVRLLSLPIAKKYNLQGRPVPQHHAASAGGALLGPFGFCVCSARRRRRCAAPECWPPARTCQLHLALEVPLGRQREGAEVALSQGAALPSAGQWWERLAALLGHSQQQVPEQGCGCLGLAGGGGGAAHGASCSCSTLPETLQLLQLVAQPRRHGVRRPSLLADGALPRTRPEHCVRRLHLLTLKGTSCWSLAALFWEAPPTDVLQEDVALVWFEQAQCAIVDMETFTCCTKYKAASRKLLMLLDVRSKLLLVVVSGDDSWDQKY
ncbi:bombesin receptor-activated protein C6orf89 homolog isoform X1 [Entelurus aequoreus]|uniref:bombesin receptor-activated protein C6orf89 homolog isoform X1 n=1 Tax=Entelurus aequoreus TaxID=161455 RepID=UPI002B1CF16A|nr:bombesin receptor-activated protein C6orf89 homolog isoform X1 [Entelurus aequoreus]